MEDDEYQYIHNFHKSREKSPEKDYPWDVVMERSDKVLNQLIKDGHSYQDVYHIGARLMLAGQTLFVMGGANYQKEEDSP